MMEQIMNFPERKATTTAKNAAQANGGHAFVIPLEKKREEKKERTGRTEKGDILFLTPMKEGELEKFEEKDYSDLIGKKLRCPFLDPIHLFSIDRISWKEGIAINDGNGKIFLRAFPKSGFTNGYKRTMLAIIGMARKGIVNPFTLELFQLGLYEKGPERTGMNLIITLELMKKLRVIR